MAVAAVLGVLVVQVLNLVIVLLVGTAILRRVKE